MFNIYKKNKIPRLEQKKTFINNDIRLSDYDPLAVFTLVLIPTLMLISMKIYMISGTI